MTRPKGPMTTPRTRQANDLLGWIKRQDWAKLRRRTQEALRRADSPGPVRDGLGRAGDQAGVSGGGISDPTYGAAVGREPADPVDEHARRALDHLDQGVAHLQQFVVQIQALEQLASDEDLNPEPICWAMARVGSVEQVHRTGTVAGRLREGRPLGKWAYDFVVHQGRLPTVEECRARAEGRRVRVSA